jgi:hypothetical protein
MPLRRVLEINLAQYQKIHQEVLTAIDAIASDVERL